jgi:aryl-alcohol dehydrogenase-like predicted oxidoreductase
MRLSTHGLHPAFAVNAAPMLYRRCSSPPEPTGTNRRSWKAADRQNLELVRAAEKIAQQKGTLPAQLALARGLARGPDIVPIPGTKRVRYLERNLAAAEVELTGDDQNGSMRSSP